MDARGLWENGIGGKIGLTAGVILVGLMAMAFSGEPITSFAEGFVLTLLALSTGLAVVWIVGCICPWLVIGPIVLPILAIDFVRNWHLTRHNRRREKFRARSEAVMRQRRLPITFLDNP